MPVQLLPPKVIPPLSECSEYVRLQCLWPVASVQIFAGGHVVGGGTASNVDQTFRLTRKLTSGEVVQASQSSAGVGSDLTPDGPTVLRSPASSSEIGPVNLVSHIYQCGACLWLDGAFPGAKVDVTSSGILRGSATSVDGNARLPLSGVTAIGEVLEASTTACGLPGPITRLPKADPLPADTHRHDAPPKIVGPLYECQQQILVNAVFDGATVTVHRGTGDEFACFDRNELRLNLTRPLDKTEVLTASQTTVCEIASVASKPPVPVFPTSLPAPFLFEPICKRDRWVRVAGLIPMASVMFYADGDNEFAYGMAWDSVCDFPMPDLGSVKILRVRQGLCSPVQWSDPSNDVQIGQGPAQGDLFLKLTRPLIQCGRIVHVTGCAPGVMLHLISDKVWPHGEIGVPTYATEYEADIETTVPLSAGDYVHVEAKLCGDLYSSPSEEVVRLQHDLLPPIVSDPVCDCGGVIHVTGVAPGAAVEAYVNGAFAGSTRSPFSFANVPIAKRLVEGDSVQARQTLCTQTTNLGDPKSYFEASDVELAQLSGVVSARICQLTGAHDPVPGHGHVNDTSQWGVYGTDLGVSFEHNGRQYFFFGDEGIDDPGDDDSRDADPMFYTSDYAVKPFGIHLHPILESGRTHFRRLTVKGVNLDNFGVPTGGFSYNNKLYVFVADKVDRDSDKYMRQSFLGAATDLTTNFDLLYPVDIDFNADSAQPKFINISPVVVNNADWPTLPVQVGDGLLLFGSGKYRSGGISIAWAPLTPGADPPPPSQWWMYDSKLGWQRPSGTATPGGYTAAKPVDGPLGVGELSVLYVAPLRRWLILCSQGQVVGFTAKEPTGPWTALSAPVFEWERDGARGVYMHDKDGTDDLVDRAWTQEPDKTSGAAYGPYLISRFTKWNPWTRTTALYYAMSTHIPYQVQLMRFELKCK